MVCAALDSDRSLNVEIVKQAVKFVCRNQNYAMLKKAPLSLSTEKFNIANAVVKIESALLGVLENTQLNQVDKVLVIDLIKVRTKARISLMTLMLAQDVASSRADSFSQFFYEEFVRLLLSNSQFVSTVASGPGAERRGHHPLRVSSFDCLRGLHYQLCSRLFCEEELMLDLANGRSVQGVASSGTATVTTATINEKEIQRANDFNSLLLKGLFVDTC